MRDGSAYLELAKMHIARSQNTEAAAELLRRATKMSADDVSEEEKAEAEALLETIRTSLLSKRKKPGVRRRRQQLKPSIRTSRPGRSKT